MYNMKNWFKGLKMFFAGIFTDIFKKRSKNNKVLTDNGGVEITHEELTSIIKSKLVEKTFSSMYISIADKKYYCPTKEFIEKIIKKTNIESYKYRPEVFDCDDFAHLLRCEFIKVAYKDNKRTTPFAFGVVYGAMPNSHAMNMFIDSKKNIYFVEPQNDSFILPTNDKIKYIRTVII